MSGWTHYVCLACYDRFQPGRVPFLLLEPPGTACCACGAEDGPVLYRLNPALCLAPKNHIKGDSSRGQYRAAAEELSKMHNERSVNDGPEAGWIDGKFYVAKQEQPDGKVHAVGCVCESCSASYERDKQRGGYE